MTPALDTLRNLLPGANWQEVARRLGIAPQNLSRLRRTGRSPSIASVQAMLEAWQESGAPAVELVITADGIEARRR